MGKLARQHSLKITLLVSIACMSPAGLAQKQSSHGPNAADIDSQIQRRYRSLKSISYNMHGKISLRGPGGEVPIAIISSSLRAAKPNQFYAEVTAEHLGREFHGTFVSDGTKIWDFDSDNQVYMEKLWTSLPKSSSAAGDWFNGRAAGDVSLAYLLYYWRAIPNDSKNVVPAIRSVMLPNGYPAYSLEMRGGMGIPAGNTASLAFDKRDLILRRVTLNGPAPAKEAKGAHLTLVLSLDFDDVVIDEPAPDDAFKFQPPSEARFVPNVKPVGQRATAVDNSEIRDPRKKETEPGEDKKPPA